MTNFEKASLTAASKSVKPTVHVKQGVNQADLGKYIAEIYTCRKHCILSSQTQIPSLLLSAFGKLHIDDLIPAAILLDIRADDHFQKVSTFNDTQLDTMLADHSSHARLSSLQKFVLRWAFKET
ncbi:hypothetical protein J3R30DRAFT_3695487 [Lentinula aciculospora]|uniref:Uncharacterized protein n=1 Tax=Lentinula aciculospora TaxID=153920 RepID=A0A9W9APT9_9AGAR|nr:hypothetical protein J3R30DRAFT_3695487 [Lentinula aciculospora]